MPVAYLAAPRTILSIVGVAMLSSTISNIATTTVTTIEPQELSSFGGGFLFCFIAYLGGAGWGSLSAAEKLQAALVDPGGGDPLQPSGINESYDENSGHLDLFVPRLLPTTSAVDKDIMAEVQPVFENDISIPGMVGLWAAAASNVTKEENEASSGTVPHALQMQEEVCVADAVRVWTGHKLAQASNSVIKVTIAKHTLFHFIATLIRLFGSGLFNDLVATALVHLCDAYNRHIFSKLANVYHWLLAAEFAHHFDVFDRFILAAPPWVLLILAVSLAANIYQYEKGKTLTALGPSSPILPHINLDVIFATPDENLGAPSVYPDKPTTDAASLTLSEEARLPDSHVLTTLIVPIIAAPAAATDAHKQPNQPTTIATTVTASALVADANAYELPAPVTASVIPPAISPDWMDAARGSEDSVPAHEEIEEDVVRVLDKGKSQAVEIEEKEEQEGRVSSAWADDEDIADVAYFADDCRISLEGQPSSAEVSPSIWVPEASASASSSQAYNSSSASPVSNSARLNAMTPPSNSRNRVSTGKQSSPARASLSVLASQAYAGALSSRASSPPPLPSAKSQVSNLAESTAVAPSSNEKDIRDTKKVARQLLYHQRPAPIPPPTGDAIKWTPGVPFVATPTVSSLSAIEAKEPNTKFTDKHTKALMEVIPAPPLSKMRDTKDLTKLLPKDVAKNMRASSASFAAWKASLQ
ncbi:hypothetical protein HWV62_19689 [Athelia sp. TMB]|nr:hypothetical protein HWV62_19689 [Athelia sp. TMB]